MQDQWITRDLNLDSRLDLTFNKQAQEQTAPTYLDNNTIDLYMKMIYWRVSFIHRPISNH